MKKNIKFLIILLIAFFLLFSTYSFAKSSNTDIEHGIKDTYSGLKLFFDFVFGNNYIDFNANISKEQMQTNNRVVLAFTILLMIYWLFLLFKFEKEKTVYFECEDDFKTLNKYNPLIAACLADNREVLSRDILAVLVNLINKNIIKLDIVPIEPDYSSIDENKKYKYILTRVKENEGKMDNIEAYVHGLFFNYSYNNGTTIRLDEAIEELNKNKDLNFKMQELNSMASKKLNSIGANLRSVPITIRFTNFILLFLSIVLGIFHFTSNTSIKLYYSSIYLTLLIIAFSIIFALPLIYILFKCFIIFIAYVKRLINKTNENYTGQKIVSTTIAIFLVSFVLMLISYIITKDYVLMMDIFMIGIAALIVKTDHLMSKNHDSILSDYYSLNYIKYKIEEYSLLDEKNLHYITLWENYLAYAISFGFAEQMLNKVRKTYDDDLDIRKCLNLIEFLDMSNTYINYMFGLNLSWRDMYYSKEDPNPPSKELYFYPEHTIDKRTKLDFWFEPRK